MNIKNHYRNRVLTEAHPFIPGGVKKRLGDLTKTEVRALHAKGYLSDELIEEEPKKGKKKALTDGDAKADLEGTPRPDNPTKEATKKQNEASNIS